MDRILFFFVLLSYQAWSLPTELKPVDKSKICMQLDEAYPIKQRSIKIKGNSYTYCCDRCKSKLLEIPELRLAKDPFSGKEINKAKSFPASTAEGKVFYFENEENFKKFISQKAPSSSDGLSP